MPKLPHRHFQRWAVGRSVFGMALVGSVACASGQIRVFVGTSPVVFAAAQPLRKGGRVMIPLREVAERLGWTVAAGPLGRGLTLAQGATRVALPLTGGKATRNGIPIPNAFYPSFSKGRVLVPVRFFSDALKSTTAYNTRRGTVQIFPRSGGKAGSTASPKRGATKP